MAINSSKLPAKQLNTKYLTLTAIVFLIFCGLSLLSQIANPVFGLVALMGIGYPILWGMKNKNCKEMGFAKQNMKKAILWSVIAGILTSFIGIIVLPEISIAEKLGLQLAIGIPIWALVASPFQEFFFRGWCKQDSRNRWAVGGDC